MASDRPTARGVGRRLGISLALWLAVVGVVWAYLDRAAPPPYRAGARAITDADSYGLPLVAFALGLAAALAVVNVALLLAAHARRGRARYRSGAPPDRA